ncbi:MAG: extracellular solute-binding protein [Methylobacterium frigidaeris]
MRIRAVMAGGLILGAIGLAAAAAAGAEAAERTRLRIATAFEPEQIAAAKQAIEAAVPEVEVVWERAATGILTERILDGTEGRPDMAFGLAVTSLLQFEQAGLLAAYTPKGAERLRTSFRDPAPPYSWSGMDAFLGVICFNAEAAARERLSRPNFWRDLLNPLLKGRVVMPDPTRSGTGYMLVSGWLQSMGEEPAWAFMDALHEQVATYPPSGTAPCAEAAAGRMAAGLSFDMRAATEKGAGAPIDIVVPVDGTGWDQEGLAIFAGTAHPDLARRVADWGVSREANQLYAQTYAVVAYPGVSNPAPDLPAARRGADDPHRPRLDGEPPRPHRRRVAPTLRRQGGALRGGVVASDRSPSRPVRTRRRRGCSRMRPRSTAAARLQAKFSPLRNTSCERQ